MGNEEVKMNFEYNEDQLNIKEMAKNFAETELMPSCI